MVRAKSKHQNHFLVGKSVYLRRVRITDAPFILKWHNDPGLRKLARSGAPRMTLKNERKDIRSARRSENEAYLMVIRKSDNRLIGFIRLNGITSASIRVWLRIIIGDKSAWGKNYASDAMRTVLKWLFYELDIHRVELETYATNKRALRFFEKMGFKREGILREAHFTNGKYYDIISFGLLKKEFKKF